MQPSTRTHLRALALGALTLVLGGSCTQPTMNCTTAHLPYAAKFTLKSGDPNSPCGQLKGDILGMQTYFATGGVNGTAKFADPSAAIRTQTAGLLVDEGLNYAVPVPGFSDPDEVLHLPNALGDFEGGEPDGDDFCHVKKLGPARVDRPELPLIPEVPAVPDDPATPEDETMEGTPEVPATPPISISHEWTNARWLVNPDAQGTQFEADLKFTQDDCTAEYHVVAVSPAVHCMSDADCTADGSGLNPDFAVRCDPDIDGGVCVLAKDIPSYE